MTDRLFDSFGVLSQCPNCAASYSQDDVRFVRHRDQKSIFHLICPGCQQAMLFSVQKRWGGLACAGIITDWSFEDAKRFLEAKAITVDDVITVHRALELDNFLRIS